MCEVVYLDDELDLCEVFQDLFSAPGVTIRTYSDPKAFFKGIEENRPDVVFLDYRLPGTNGDEVAAQISEAVPKYLITADFEVETKSHFIEKLLKPYNSEKIEAIIKKYCEGKKHLAG